MSLHDFAQLRKRAILRCSAQHQAFTDLYKTTTLSLQKLGFRMKHTHPKLYQRLLSYAACPRQISGAELHAFVTGEISGRCVECKGYTKFDANKHRYREFCSQHCVRTSQIPLRRREDTWLSKYGTTNPLKNTEVWHRKVQTCQERYGYDVPSQNKEVAAKIGHSVSRVYRTTDVLERRRETCMRKYGVPHTGLVPAIVKKSVVSARRTNLSKYGVEHLMQLPQYAEKHKRNSYRVKEFYSRKNKRVLRCQGAEPEALRRLEHNSSISCFDTDCRVMPKVWYTWQGKRRRYFPDIAYETQGGHNGYIEVKVPYTLRADLDRNKAKLRATLSLGHTIYLCLIVGSQALWHKNPEDTLLDKICAQYS